jgi:AcrR family transcriptional regulator
MSRYPVNVGRPKEHDERTAAALLDAAERSIQARGVEAVSVRWVAEQIGTTTRAVYSLFGSKDGLLVALGVRAFGMLGEAVRALPETEDPARDLVEGGVLVFRRFVVDHPILFRIGFGRGVVPPELAAQFEGGTPGCPGGLVAKVERLDQPGLLRGRTVWEAVSHFHALCEGSAELELRRNLPPGQKSGCGATPSQHSSAGWGSCPGSTELSRRPEAPTGTARRISQTHRRWRHHLL